MTTPAYIVWNADKTEGVIFIDAADVDKSSCLYTSSEADAEVAAYGPTGPVSSSLALAFHELYDDPEEQGECVIVETTAEVLRAL